MCFILCNTQNISISETSDKMDWKIEYTIKQKMQKKKFTTVRFKIYGF